MKQFYERTPLPNYDETDSISALVKKSTKGVFARLLDDQLRSQVLQRRCVGQGFLLKITSTRAVFARPGPRRQLVPDVNAPPQLSDSLASFDRGSGSPRPRPSLLGQAHILPTGSATGACACEPTRSGEDEPALHPTGISRGET